MRPLLTLFRTPPVVTFPTAADATRHAVQLVTLPHRDLAPAVTLTESRLSADIASHIGTIPHTFRVDLKRNDGMPYAEITLHCLESVNHLATWTVWVEQYESNPAFLYWEG